MNVLESHSRQRAHQIFLLLRLAPPTGLLQESRLRLLRALIVLYTEMRLPCSNGRLTILSLIVAPTTSCGRVQINNATLEQVKDYAYNPILPKGSLVSGLNWCPQHTTQLPSQHKQSMVLAPRLRLARNCRDLHRLSAVLRVITQLLPSTRALVIIQGETNEKRRLHMTSASLKIEALLTLTSLNLVALPLSRLAVRTCSTHLPRDENVTLLVIRYCL